jgi:hypothetical protein
MKVPYKVVRFKTRGLVFSKALMAKVVLALPTTPMISVEEVTGAFKIICIG